MSGAVEGVRHGLVMPDAVVLVSGGLDSVTLAHRLHADGYALLLLGFDYGQRHHRELIEARKCADRLGATHRQIDLRSVGSLLTGSALTDGNVPVPHGHYAEASMAATVVPNRNAIFLSIAYAIAVSSRAQLVAMAVHAGDHYIYPDCRPAFIEAFEQMQRLAVEGFGHPSLRLHTPFLHLRKHEIVSVGHKADVPFADTWSCYEGGTRHCGRCGTCVERKEAFMLARVEDPTQYDA